MEDIEQGISEIYVEIDRALLPDVENIRISRFVCQ